MSKQHISKTICGATDCEGCFIKYANDIEICKKQKKEENNMNKEWKIMKPFELKDYKQFCEEAFVAPPTKDKESIMKMFKEFDVYGEYSYCEMKVMYVLAQMEETRDLDYEDLMRIAAEVFICWADSERREEYPWLAFEAIEEDGYIQVYASRVLPEIIKLYKEVVKND